MPAPSRSLALGAAAAAAVIVIRIATDHGDPAATAAAIPEPPPVDAAPPPPPAPPVLGPSTTRLEMARYLTPDGMASLLAEPAVAAKQAPASIALVPVPAHPRDEHLSRRLFPAEAAHVER